MRTKERIPLHDHVDNNSGGPLSGSTLVIASGGPTAPSGGGITVHEFAGPLHTTTETDTSKVAHPDGTGGVEWGPDATGSATCFNPIDYGAVGDGVTNDTTAIQAAEDAAFAAGGSVCWPGGNFLSGAITRHSIVEWSGSGYDSTTILANADSINMVTTTGSAFGGGSVPEIESARGIYGIRFDANGHSGVVGIGNIGIAYYEIARNRFVDLATAIDNYGSLQYDIHHNQFQDCTVDVYNHAETIPYRSTTPPNKVRVANNNHEGTVEWAVKHSGGAGLILRDQEYDLCGTTSDTDTGCVLFDEDGLNDEFAQGIDSSGGWAEGTKGFGVFKLTASTSGHVHSIRDLNVPTNEAAHVIGVDGSGAGKHIVVIDNVQVADSATNRDFYRTGSEVELWLLNSRGALAGSGGTVYQQPLVDGQLVSDLSQLDALRLPNHTTTERDAISSPTAGMTLWNTTTSAVNVYTGAAWAAVGGSTLTPATTVTDETTWGITPAVGTDTEYARQDHTHGSPAEPTGGGHLVIASVHSTPLVFADIVQNTAGDDFIYSSS